ncbi:MAG: MFS transporter [Phycisphaerales bacterium]|nr:MAG: MFS transporter [Phycisphaerales bacterium]
MKKMTSIVAIMAVFTLAVCFVMIGAASVELEAKLGLTKGQIGMMVLLFSLTCIVAQLAAGPLVDRIGHKPLAVTGFLVAGASIFLLAFAGNYVLAVLAAILLGIGAICCNTVGNTLLPVVLFDGKEPARASNFGNAFVGLGFALPPLLIGVLQTDVGMSYEATLSLIAVFVLAFTVFAVLSSYPQVSTGFEMSRAIALLRSPVVLMAALALVCYIGLEFAMNTWIRLLMVELYEKAGSDEAGIARNAGLVLTAFALAMAIGRFGTSAIKNLTAIGTVVIAAMAALAFVTIGVMCVAGSPTVAIGAVFITGLAFAPMFPTIVGVTFSKFEPSLYGSVFGTIFAIGLLGPAFLPYVIGKASEAGSIQKAMPVAAVVAAVLCVVGLLMGVVFAREKASVRSQCCDQAV